MTTMTAPSDYTSSVVPDENDNWSSGAIQVDFRDSDDLHDGIAADVESSGKRPLYPRGKWKNVGDPFCKDYVNRCLNELAALRPNWDGYGAPQLSHAILKAARDMTARIDYGIPRPSVVPMSSGKVQFEWQFGSRELEIEIESTGQIHFLKWDPVHHVEQEGVYEIGDLGQTIGLIAWVQQGLNND